MDKQGTTLGAQTYDRPGRGHRARAASAGDVDADDVKRRFVREVCRTGAAPQVTQRLRRRCVIAGFPCGDTTGDWPPLITFGVMR